MKCELRQMDMETGGRSPYGERGLKYDGAAHAGAAVQSLSLRRAWIEIKTPHPPLRAVGRSPYGERGLK